MICETCGNEHDGSFGSGRFCCRSCANTRRMTPLIRERISKGVIRTIQKDTYTYVCEKCGKKFSTNKTFKKNRHIHCNDCIQKRQHTKDVNNILDVSKRTVSKILKRANVPCVLCGWNESSLDIHHIVPKSNGGTDDMSNLITVCPNCHRVIHNTDKYSEEYLKSLSIKYKFTNWKDYYNI